MPVHVEATQTVIIGYDGKKEEKSRTVVTAKCDGPKCQKEDSTCPGTYTWVEQEPDGIPDGVYRMLIVQDFNGQKVVLFTKECLRDLMRNYTPPLSPREQAKIAENNAIVDKKNNPDSPVGPLAVTPLNPSVVENNQAGSEAEGQGSVPSTPKFPTGD